MNEGEILKLKPKMGIIPEVTAQNYETIAKQLREPITNSLDAKATSVFITLSPDAKSTDLILTDNGTGMNEYEFKEFFLSLGGSHKYSDLNAIGRIGIGFMACAPLCKKIEIHTRKDDSFAFVAEINVMELFDKAVRYDQIVEFPIGKILKVYDKNDLEGRETHYTTVILKELHPEVLKTFNNEKLLAVLLDELKKILPIKYPENCGLFKSISPEMKDVLLSETPTIEVYYNGQLLKRRAYGDLKDEICKVKMEFFNEGLGIGKVTGYLIDKGHPMRQWKGLITRFQNIAVEDRGFLGWDKRPAALNRITGELFLSGLDKNKAITINRNSFNVTDEDYLEIRDLIYDKLNKFTSKAYQRSYRAAEINKEIKKTVNLKKNLKRVSSEISKSKKTITPIQTEVIPSSIKKTPLNLQTISTKSYGEYKTEIKTQSGTKKGDYDIEWSGNDGTDANIIISEKLMRETGDDITLEGKLYKVFFFEDKIHLNPCIINDDEHEINFNIAHPCVKDKDDKIITFIFLLTYYAAKVKNIQEYREKIIGALSVII